MEPFDLGLGEPPAPPQMPAPSSADPSKASKLIQLALMGLAGGLGPGAGTGILQGLHQTTQQRRQDAMLQDRQNAQRYEQEQQTYERQARQYQQQQALKQKAVADAFESLQKDAVNLPSRKALEERANMYAQSLGYMGIRMSPQALVGQVRYLEPKERDVVANAVNANQKQYPEAWKNGAPLDSHIRYTDPTTGEEKDIQIRQAIAAGLIDLPVDETGAWKGTQAVKPQPAQPFTLGPNQIRYNPDGTVVARGPVKAEGGAAKAPDKPDQIFVLRDGVVTPIEKGTAQPGDRPYNAADAKMNATASDVKSKRTTLADNALDAITSLEKASGLTAIFGAPALTQPGSWGRLVGMDPISGSASADAKAQLDRLLGLITLPELQNMRGLGAMSDREFATISKAATTLSTKMSDRAAAAELARLKKAFESMRQTPGGTPVGDIGTTGGAVSVGGQTFSVQVVP